MRRIQILSNTMVCSLQYEVDDKTLRSLQNLDDADDIMQSIQHLGTLVVDPEPLTATLYLNSQQDDVEKLKLLLSR